MAEDQKIIVIRLDASHEKGLGHLYRMLTLAKSFQEDNFLCFFLIRQNQIAEELIEEAQFPFFTCSIESSEEEMINIFLRKHPRPVLWIFDILSTDKKTIFQVKNKGIPTVTFDDLRGGPAYADLTINAIAGCWNEISSTANILCGPEYAIIDPGILDLKSTQGSSDGQKAKHVGIFLGGSDTHGATVELAQILSGFKDIRTDYFLGPHFQHEKELNETLKNASCRFGIHKAIKDLHKKLLNMDIIICGGGQTLFELCSMGMAVMALANEEHEERTIAYFAEHGACLPVGSVHKTIKADVIRKIICDEGTKAQSIAEMCRRAIALVDGKGCTRCHQACLEIIRKSELIKNAGVQIS